MAKDSLMYGAEWLIEIWVMLILHTTRMSMTPRLQVLTTISQASLGSDYKKLLIATGCCLSVPLGICASPKGNLLLCAAVVCATYMSSCDTKFRFSEVATLGMGIVIL